MMKVFAAEVKEGKQGEDGKPSVGPIYRNLLSKHDFPPPHPNISTAWDISSVSVKKHPDNKMLGWREFVNGKFGPYIWKTYKQVFEEVVNIGSALRASGAEPGCRVGIYGANCPEWTIAMEAFSAHSLICVPLYDTLGPNAVNFIIDHAEVDFVFIQHKKVKDLLNPSCKAAARLKAVVCFSSLTNDDKDKTAERGIKPYSWQEFQVMGLRIQPT